MKAACKHHRILRCVDCEVETLKTKVEEMQKALEWYASDEFAQTVKNYYFGETLFEGCGQRAKVTLKGATNEQSNH